MLIKVINIKLKIKTQSNLNGSQKIIYGAGSSLIHINKRQGEPWCIASMIANENFKLMIDIYEKIPSIP